MPRTHFLAASFFAVLLLFVLTHTAQASLIGDDIRLEVSSDLNPPFFDETAVGNLTTVEFTNVSGNSDFPINVDILDENTILISFSYEFSDPGINAGFSSRDFTFSDVDWAGAGNVVDLANFSLTDGASSTTYAGFDLLSPTSFRINDVAMGITFDNPQATLMFDVVSSHDVTVPTPATLLLFGLGLAGLGFGMRRR